MFWTADGAIGVAPGTDIMLVDKFGDGVPAGKRWPACSPKT